MTSVGDMSYEKESEDARDATSGPEPPMPTIFSKEGDLSDWWATLKRVTAIVRDKNAEPEKAPLTPSHVATHTAALPTLLAAQMFVSRVLRDEVPCVELEPVRGEQTFSWDDTLGDPVQGTFAGADQGQGRISIRPPLRLVQEGRQKIAREEWKRLD